MMIRSPFDNFYVYFVLLDDDGVNRNAYECHSIEDARLGDKENRWSEQII
jgi:hypothetical protein